MSDDAKMAGIREATSNFVKKFVLFHATLCTQVPCPHNFREEMDKIDVAFADGEGKDFLARLKAAEAGVQSSSERAEHEKNKRIAVENRLKSSEEENTKLKKALKS